MYSSSMFRLGLSPSPSEGTFYLVEIPSRVRRRVHLDAKLAVFALVGESVVDRFLFIEI